MQYFGSGEIFDCIEKKNNRVIIELGASRGDTTNGIITRMHNSDKLYVVEADNRCIEKLNDKYKNESRIDITHAAIYKEDLDEIVFHLCTAEHLGYGIWDCASSLKKIKHGLVVNPWLKYEQDINVRAITLDTLFQEKNIKYCDFIWCDVEGSYAEVVEGGKKALKITKFLYIECEDVETYEGEIMCPAFKQIMENIGFELIQRFQYDALFRNKKYD